MFEIPLSSNSFYSIEKRLSLPNYNSVTKMTSFPRGGISKEIVGYADVMNETLIQKVHPYSTLS